MRTLQIKPDGNMVKGGQVSYQFAKDGTVNLSLEVNAHYLWADHKISQSGTYHVPARLIASAKNGDEFKLGKFDLRFTSPNLATINIEGLGSGAVDFAHDSGELIINHMKATGSFMGESVVLETV